ncbi:hypothetical protein [Lederbergia wuyishanensis]|uniref:Uncharacterized protein n=3 Tax=Lederbergia wuyishanensis TaxID=1347903 RepID=A0ABU0D750_9BACI|nr:hypothetical protein [Lederbergia wuyishanensis]MCJ8008890.1 hypothetical protein [Lederbergia wuyishanensis]MDQ0344215.1 hypothetical protein [Lederbergia wuyishanensis]
MASNTEQLGLLKKDPVVDANDTFNIETMLNENWDKVDDFAKTVDEHLAERLQDGVHGLATTQNIIYYVDAVKGNDNNNGLTKDTAFKNIQTAIDKLPKNIMHDVRIRVLPGDYSSQGIIEVHGFRSMRSLLSSVNDFKIIAFDGDVEITDIAKAINYKVYAIRVTNCHATVSVSSFYPTNTDYAFGLGVDSSARVLFMSCMDSVSASRDGIFASASRVENHGCSLSNKAFAISSRRSAHVYSAASSGSQNQVALYATEGGVISKRTGQPSGTTAERIDNGGAIR